jgi:DNA gyrase subunit A
MIRMGVGDIRVISRVTQGVRLIDLDEGDKLVSATTVEPEDDDLINGNGDSPAAEPNPPAPAVPPATPADAGAP